MFLHGNVGAFFFAERIAVCGITLFFVKGAGAFLCGEHNNFSASGTDAPFRKLQKRRAQMRAAEGFQHGEPPDMPAVFFFEIAAGSPFT